MAIPQAIQDAILTEVTEGQKLQEQIQKLKDANVEKEAQITALNNLVATDNVELGTLRARIAQLEEVSGTISEIVDAIAQINPTPVSDAVVEEVTSNPDIETPDLVNSAPPVSNTVVQSEPVVTAALEALSDAE